MPLRILHTNDLHGKLDEKAELSMKPLRSECDFYVDSGDAVRSGNVGIPLSADSVWQHFRKLRCSAGTCGNREFHISEKGFRAKIKGCCHPLLVSNLEWNGRPRRPLQSDWPDSPLRKSIVLNKVGFIGVMLPMVTQRMAARHISAFINTNPIDAVRREAKKLAPNCECVICISHLGLARDLKLAEAVPQLSLILGGHSHEAIEKPVRVGNCWVCQSGSHARFAGVYEWDGALKSAQLIRLKESPKTRRSG